MIININSEDISDLIINKLVNKNPFLLTRIGDGEAIAYENNKNNKLTEHVYKRHLGQFLEDKKRKEISDNLYSTIKKSDILSLRRNYDMDELKIWKKVPEIYTKILNNEELNKIKFCNHDFHFLFTNESFLDKILNSTTNLCLITCRDVESKLKNKYKHLKNIKTLKIPGENMFEEDKKIQPYYPDIFEKIKNEILSENRSGHLLLLGGGFVGKKFGVHFKEMGGVSVDIGSVFDLWVGKVTRGPGRGNKSYIKPLL